MLLFSTRSLHNWCIYLKSVDFAEIKDNLEVLDSFTLIKMLSTIADLPFKKQNLHREYYICLEIIL